MQPKAVSPEVAQLHIAQAVNGASLATMRVQDALPIWLESRRSFLSEKTLREYRFNVLRLSSSLLGEMCVTDIEPDHMRQYQSLRLAAGCGPHGINHECSVLQQLLKRVGRWPQLEHDYQPLHLPDPGVGRALDDEEQTRLLRIAKSRDRWEHVYAFILISLHTTAGPGEVMTLRRKDIDLEKRVLNVTSEGAKNRFRIRPIPLNDVALESCEFALEVGAKKGAILPDHFVFPYRCGGNLPASQFDPTRHITTFKTAWEQIRIAAGLGDLRLYDLRHTSITRLYENPNNSQETIEQIAGHHGPAMKKRYAHIRMEAKRAALARLVPPRNERLVERLLAKTVAEGGAPAPRTGRPLTNQDVLDLLKAEMSPKLIVAKVERSHGSTFDTSPEAMKQLKRAGVPESVILVMIQAE